MKKLTAMVLALVMVLALCAGAFADGGKLTKEEAKQIALDKAGVTAAEATFTKAKLDYDDGREEYEFEFYANGKEYDVDVNARTGKVVKFEVERCCRDFDDRYERDFDDYYDDRYDRDFDDYYDDRYDFDYDDRYDFDDWYDFD